jgi:hypothetical protein
MTDADVLIQISEELKRQPSYEDRLRITLEFLRDKDKVRALSEFLAKLYITLPDAHFAIYCASELDNALELILLSKMRTLNRDLKDHLFDGYGPLSTFSAKIDISYALQLIPQDVYKSLKTINKIRNKFAHTRTYLNFDDHEISQLIR